MIHVCFCGLKEDTVSVFTEVLNGIYKSTLRRYNIFSFPDIDTMERKLGKNLKDIQFLWINLEKEKDYLKIIEMRKRGVAAELICSNLLGEEAAELLDYNLFSYFLKNEEEILENLEEVEKAFTRIALYIRARKKDKYLIEAAGVVYLIPFDEIYYINSQSRKIMIHGVHKEWGMYAKINDIENVFLEHGFIRCHHSYLVNSLFVDRIENKNLILKTSEVVPISASRYKEIEKVRGV